MRTSLLTAAMLVVVVPACVAPSRHTAGPAARTPDAAELQTRAQRLWDARLAEDWATTLLYEVPERRAQIDPNTYATWCRDSEPFVIKSFELLGVQTERQLGWVNVKSTTTMRKFPALPPHDSQRWEKWQVVDGQWYPVAPPDRDKYPEAPADRDQAEEARLAARFAEAWRARHAKDWPAFQGFVDPRDREQLTVEELAQQESSFDRLSANVQWVQVIGDHGQVRVQYEVKRADPSLTKMPPETIDILERWVKFEGEWYRQLGKKS